jgi:hypothetical protein
MCSGAFGLSTASQNHAVVCFGDRVAYITGKYVVAYSQDVEASPRMLLSQPDQNVQQVISLSSSLDHKTLATIEQLMDGSYHISFWTAEMAPCKPIISHSRMKVCSLSGLGLIVLNVLKHKGARGFCGNLTPVVQSSTLIRHLTQQTLVYFQVYSLDSIKKVS